jgi:cyclase
MDTSNLRTLELTGTLLGFYDGRVPGQELGPNPTWIDDGALSLGTCSFAIVDGADALVYDTHVSVPHARAIRAELERRGVSRITVVLSHWHLDHIAGTEAFADREVIANALTAKLMTEHRAEIEEGRRAGPPAISPLILPTRTFTDALHLDVGSVAVELLQFDIHSRDATVLHIPAEGILLAGDTLEDTVTYVAEPDGLARHLQELERLRALGASRIYPNHGSMEGLTGAYSEGLILATERYIEELLRHARDPRPEDADMHAFVADSLSQGWIGYFAPYERVHESNLESVRG